MALVHALVACLAMSWMNTAPSLAQGDDRDDHREQSLRRGTLVINSAADIGSRRVNVQWELQNATAAVKKLCVHWQIILPNRSWRHECHAGSGDNGNVVFDTSNDHNNPLAWVAAVSVYLNLHYLNVYPSSFSRTATIAVRR